jgi:cytochrome c-type biogenesis protein CcsB
MGHAGGDSDRQQNVELSYRYSRNLYLQKSGDGIMGHADFALEIGTPHDHAAGDHESHEDKIEQVEPGSQFAVKAGVTMKSGSFSAATAGAYASGVEVAGMSEDTSKSSAVAVVITDAAGNESDPTVLKWQEEGALTLNDHDIFMRYGPIRIQLPYRLHLDDFVLRTYPGSDNPASFESHVRLFDEERGVDGTPIRIYMNHPLGYRGYKFFQSSYDRDRQGTVLSVNRDPGKIPTYFGYTMLTIGFLITITRGIWYRKRDPKTKARTKGNKRKVSAATAGLLALVLVGSPVHAQDQEGHNHEAPGHTHDPSLNFLSKPVRDALSILMVQDYQGRLKPLDTLSRESVLKVSKRNHPLGWEPVDMFLSWLAHPGYWFDKPILRVRHPELRIFMGVPESAKHVALKFLVNESGAYRLAGDVEGALRTPDKDRKKVQRKLLSFDERVNVFNMATRGLSLKIFPLPGDDNNRWLAPGEFNETVLAAMDPAVREEFQTAFSDLYSGLQTLDDTRILKGTRAIAAIQTKYGQSVLPSARAQAAELTLNRLQPFTWVTIPYLIAFGILMLAYAWNLARMQGKLFKLRHPLYLLGLIVYFGSVVYHLYAYVLRWIAAGHAPLSNGYESLLFIGLAIGIVGGYYELRSRRGSIGALAGLLASVILGVAMLPTFDAAISPLVPVLSSFWLIIHVTIITASYGFLGLAAVIAMTMLVLHLFKSPNRMTVRHAIIDLNILHWNVLLAGVAFLTVGTFLGGVWANESWGRYWGWDPKETWSLVTILVYAFVMHFRFVDRLNTPLNLAAGSFLGISSVGMTYFGVNYFLSGLHSYAQGDAPEVPGWVGIMATIMVLLVMAAYMVDRSRSWSKARKPAKA